jgi:hypothetical protein
MNKIDKLKGTKEFVQSGMFIDEFENLGMVSKINGM